MSLLTLQLPKTLHRQLAHLAEIEGVSLNQFIVHALTSQTTSAHTIQFLPETEVELQQQSFQSLKKRLGQSSSTDEIKSILATRKQVEPEAELSLEVVAHLQEMIRKKG